MIAHWDITLRFYRRAREVCEGHLPREEFLRELAEAARNGTIPQAWNGDFREELARLAGRMTEGTEAVQSANWLG